MSPADATPAAGLAYSEASAPFWAGLAEGKLLLPHCQWCRKAFFYPRRSCPRCWSSEITWQASEGRGTIFSVTTVHVPFDPAFEVPYSVALIDLDEGVRITGRLEPADEPFAIGDHVHIVFAADPGATLPVFRRVAAA